VFVIGAGTGHDINMPAGPKLAAQLASVLNLQAGSFEQKRTGDEKIWRALQVENLKNAGHPSNIDHFRRAAVQISEGIATADSIDDFLHRCERRPDADAIRLSGKLGIARCILNAERSSHLHYSTESMFNKMDLNKLTATWYMKMFRLLVRHHTDAQQIFENVSFINFNYDPLP
jgi:hypothetical protein